MYVTPPTPARTAMTAAMIPTVLAVLEVFSVGVSELSLETVLSFELGVFVEDDVGDESLVADVAASVG